MKSGYVMSNITIVTAFFDIGRSQWTPDKGLPHYLYRTNETYMERFSYMAQLENDMIIFTTPDFISRILEIRRNRPTIIIETSLDEFSPIRERIAKVQQSEQYQKMIHPSQIKNPEYWNADYVLVNLLKSEFARIAIQRKLVYTDLVAWLDFGYCRSIDKIPPSKKWSYNFNPDYIHLFNYKEMNPIDNINRIIATNDVHILGAKIVGGHKAWVTFNDLMHTSAHQLLNNNLIDDDQTIMLVATLLQPSLFQLHKIPDHQFGHDPFIILAEFNNEYDI